MYLPPVGGDSQPWLVLALPLPALQRIFPTKQWYTQEPQNRLQVYISIFPLYTIFECYWILKKVNMHELCTIQRTSPPSGGVEQLLLWTHPALSAVEVPHHSWSPQHGWLPSPQGSLEYLHIRQGHRPTHVTHTHCAIQIMAEVYRGSSTTDRRQTYTIHYQACIYHNWRPCCWTVVSSVDWFFHTTQFPTSNALWSSR